MIIQTPSLHYMHMRKIRTLIVVEDLVKIALNMHVIILKLLYKVLH